MTREDDRIEYKLDSMKEDIHNLDTKVQVLSEKFIMHMEQDTRNLESISMALESITERLSDYNASLVEHIRRSEALEASNDLMKQQIALYKQELHSRIEALEAPHKWVKGTLKLFGVVALIAGAVTAVITLLNRI